MRISSNFTLFCASSSFSASSFYKKNELKFLLGGSIAMCIFQVFLQICELHVDWFQTTYLYHTKRDSRDLLVSVSTVDWY